MEGHGAGADTGGAVADDAGVAQRVTGLGNVELGFALAAVSRHSRPVSQALMLSLRTKIDEPTDVATSASTADLAA